MIKNEKGAIFNLKYRNKITKVRGGWTTEKIKKELKKVGATNSELIFHREILKFDDPESFAANIFYHGSSRNITDLKPSIALKYNDNFGGGSGEQYYGISVSRDKNIASNFTGISNFGYVAPIILKRNAVVEYHPDVKDALDVEELSVDLWTRGVDAIVLGDHDAPHSEKEIVILNPRCICIGKSIGFSVLKKPKIDSLNKDEIEALWLKSSETYQNIILDNWEIHNIEYKKKYGFGKDENNKRTSSQKMMIEYHKHNVSLYNDKKTLKKENVVKSKSTVGKSSILKGCQQKP